MKSLSSPVFALILSAALVAQATTPLTTLGGVFDPAGPNYSAPFKITATGGTGTGCPDCPSEVVSVAVDAKSGAISASTLGLTGTVTSSSVTETLTTQVGTNAPVVGAAAAVANVVVRPTSMTGTSNAAANGMNAISLVGPGVFSHLSTVITYRITVAHEDCKCTYEIHIEISQSTVTGAPISARAW